MEVFLIVILAIVLIFGLMFLEAWVGMFIFNWVMSLFGATFALTFWQAFGVCVLLSFVGGFFKSSSSTSKKTQW
jgi:hypothetical protein